MKTHWRVAWELEKRDAYIRYDATQKQSFEGGLLFPLCGW